MKKIWRFLLIFSVLAAGLLTRLLPAHAWTETFTLAGNYFHYTNFLRSVTSKPGDYAARITRGGVTYRDTFAASNYVSIASEDLGNPASPWSYGDDMNLATSDGEPGEWLFVLHHPGEHYLQYRLSDAQLGFANLSFVYSGLALDGVGTRLPTLAVDICGYTYAFAPDLTSGQRETVFLPNPGCSETQRTLRFYPVDESALTAGHSQILNISRLTFDAVHLGENEQVCWRRRDNALLALFERQHQVCTNHECCAGAPTYDTHATADDYWLGDLDADGEVISTTTPGTPFAAATLPLGVSVVVDHFSHEPDETLTASAHWEDTSNTYAPLAWELGISTDFDLFTGDWDALTHVLANSRADFHDLVHVSRLTHTGIANFTLPPEFSWHDGFFVQLRLRDAYEQYSPGSDIYSCQQYNCRRVDNQPVPQAYLSAIVFPESSGEALVRITLPDDESDVETLLLAEGLEQGDSLTTGQREGHTVTLSMGDLTRDSIHLRLYDQAKNKLLDAIDRDFVPVGLSLLRNPYTKQWKENYVRN